MILLWFPSKNHQLGEFVLKTNGFLLIRKIHRLYKLSSLYMIKCQLIVYDQVPAHCIWSCTAQSARPWQTHVEIPRIQMLLLTFGIPFCAFSPGHDLRVIRSANLAASQLGSLCVGRSLPPSLQEGCTGAFVVSVAHIHHLIQDVERWAIDQLDAVLKSSSRATAPPRALPPLGPSL
jgi:hypothetical protein